MLRLRRKIVPGIVSEDNTADQQSYNSRLLEDLSDHIGEKTEEENNSHFMDRLMSEKTESLQNISPKQADHKSN